MAGVNTVINVAVNDKELDRLSTKLNAVASLINRVNAVPIALDDKRASSAVQDLVSELSAFAKKQAEVKTVTYSTTAALKDQANAYLLVANNAKIGQELFKNATISAERLTRRAAAAEQERLKILKEFYTTQKVTNKQGKSEYANLGIEELVRQQKLAFGTNSIASISAFAAELQGVFELMGSGAPGRLQVLDMIVEAEKRLKSIQRQPAATAPVARTGPATELGSPKEYQQRQKFDDDLLATRKKLERISVNLDASTLSQNDKLQVRNNLAEAFNALEQKNFSLAKNLGAETDRYLRDAKSRQTVTERADRQRAAALKAIEKATYSAELSVAKLTAQFANTSDLDAWVDGFSKVENTAQEILDLSKKFGTEFDKKLKNIPTPEKPFVTRLGGGQEVRARQDYLNRLEAEVQLGKAVKLGGGQELAQRQKFDKDQIRAAEQKTSLNRIIEAQLLSFNTLANDFTLQEQRGVQIAGEKAALLRDIQAIDKKDFEINELNTKAIADRLRIYRAALALRISEAKVAGKYVTSTPEATGKSQADIIEERRNRLLLNALSLQSNIVSIESRGADLSSERLELEAKILYLKNLQGKASQEDLTILANQIQQLRIKAKTESAGLPREKRRVPFLERRLGAEKAGAVTEGLVGGAFPLLFGQGVGASIGGAVGGALGGMAGGGLGFGLSLLGTTLGSALDQSVAAATALGNALLIAKDNYSELRQQGLDFTAELEDQVRKAKEAGQYTKARDIQRSAVFSQTSDVDSLALRGVTAASNELLKAWNEVKAAVGTTLSILASPFMFALSAILRIVSSAAQGFNVIATGIAKIVSLIPGADALGATLEERAVRGTQQYEDQVAEINKQISASDKLNQTLKLKNDIIQASIGASKGEYEAAVKRAEAQERLKKLEKEIQDFRASAPTGTSELRTKALVQENQMRIKFAEDERNTLLADARTVYDQIVENNKRISELKKQYEEEYNSMVLQNSRAQQDSDISATRKLQDARMKMREQEISYIRKIGQEQIKAQELEIQQRSFGRGIEAQLSSDPTSANLINTVQTAIEQWRTGRRSVEEEYQAKQQEIQLEAQKAEISIQRYKLDNALRIARANEDSQIRINKLQEQINKQNEQASKNDVKRQQEGLLNIVGLRKGIATEQYFAVKSQADLAKAAPNAFTGEQKQRIEIDLDLAKRVYGIYDSLYKRVEQTIANVKISSAIPNLGPAPKLTDTSGVASAAESAAVTQNKKYEEQVNLLSKIQGLKREDFELVKKILDPQSSQLEQLNQILKSQQNAVEEKMRYRQLIASGVNPELAKELIAIEMIRDVQLQNLDTLIKSIEATEEFASNPKIQEIVQALKEISGGVKSKADEAISGAKKANAPGEKIKDFIAQATAELNDLESVAIRVSQSIGDAIGNSLANGISGLIEGTTTAKQVFADFLKSVGQILVQEGTKMIGMYIAIAIAKAAAGLFGGGGYSAARDSQMPNSAFIPKGGFKFPGAADGAYFSGAMSYFANGGMFTNKIVSSPTLFKFADGGSMSTGVMGEAGPEAIMPLRRGASGRLGVDASGLREAMGSAPGASSGGSVLNMTFETTSINGVEYVSREQLESAMAATRRQAASDGAKRGMSMALDKLQQSPQARRRVGI
jgi:lambda family phage tail tape measure protein